MSLDHLFPRRPVARLGCPSLVLLMLQRVSNLYIQEIKYCLEKLIGDRSPKALWTLYNYDRCLEEDILDESPPAYELYKTVLRILN